MTASSGPDERLRPGADRSPAGLNRVRQLPQVLRSWTRARVAVTVVAAGLAAVFLVAANGMMAGAGTGWTGYALVGAGPTRIAGCRRRGLHRLPAAVSHQTAATGLS